MNNCTEWKPTLIVSFKQGVIFWTKNVTLDMKQFSWNLFKIFCKSTFNVHPIILGIHVVIFVDVMMLISTFKWCRFTFCIYGLILLIHLETFDGTSRKWIFVQVYEQSVGFEEEDLTEVSMEGLTEGSPFSKRMTSNTLVVL